MSQTFSFCKLGAGKSFLLIIDWRRVDGVTHTVSVREAFQGFMQMNQYSKFPLNILGMQHIAFSTNQEVDLNPWESINIQKGCHRCLKKMLNFKTYQKKNLPSVKGKASSTKWGFKVLQNTDREREDIKGLGGCKIVEIFFSIIFRFELFSRLKLMKVQS